MIIFLNLKDQIIDGENSFSFFDTVTEKVLDFNDEQVFDSVEDFEKSYKAMYDDKEGDTHPLQRFIRLIPEDFFNEEILITPELFSTLKAVEDGKLIICSDYDEDPFSPANGMLSIAYDEDENGYRLRMSFMDRNSFVGTVIKTLKQLNGIYSSITGNNIEIN